MRYLAGALIVLIVVLALSVPPKAAAQAGVLVRAGTKVPLRFVSQLDSSTAHQGQRVNFRVASNVIVNRSVVIRAGTAAHGIVESVEPESQFGKDARIRIGFVETTGADRHPIRLSPIDITPNSIRQVKDVSGAVATSVVGAVLLGPVGLAAGALVRGGHVVVPAGAIVVAGTATSVRVRSR